MERIEIGGDARWTELVEAARQGKNVELTREGQVVARVVATPDDVEPAERQHKPTVIDWELLEKIQNGFAPLGVTDAAALIREMRDADDH